MFDFAANFGDNATVFQRAGRVLRVNLAGQSVYVLI